MKYLSSQNTLGNQQETEITFYFWEVMVFLQKGIFLLVSIAFCFHCVLLAIEE